MLTSIILISIILVSIKPQRTGLSGIFRKTRFSVFDWDGNSRFYVNLTKRREGVYGILLDSVHAFSALQAVYSKPVTHPVTHIRR